MTKNKKVEELPLTAYEKALDIKAEKQAEADRQNREQAARRVVVEERRAKLTAVISDILNSFKDSQKVMFYRGWLCAKHRALANRTQILTLITHPSPDDYDLADADDDADEPPDLCIRILLGRGVGSGDGLRAANKSYTEETIVDAVAEIMADYI